MCTVCGCGAGETRIDGLVIQRSPLRPAGAATFDPTGLPLRLGPPFAAGEVPPPAAATLDFSRGAAGVHVGGVGQGRLLQLEIDVLAKNDDFAAINRAQLAQAGVLALNLVSSPGSGKTTLLCETIRRLGNECPLAVIEGDQQTANDAERIRATGVPALQINTGKGCHLDADMVGQALARLPLARGGVLFIENVGNLVCPAAFDLGEAAKVVIFSVTEGEDKPLKYPDIFAAAGLVLLNKCDLLPYLDFDLDRALDCLAQVNPQAPVLRVSARSGAGMDAWLDWLRGARTRL